jgi:hypothetical protein
MTHHPANSAACANYQSVVARNGTRRLPARTRGREPRGHLQGLDRERVVDHRLAGPATASLTFNNIRYRKLGVPAFFDPHCPNLKSSPARGWSAATPSRHAAVAGFEA